jgi:hypothetical protein
MNFAPFLIYAFAGLVGVLLAVAWWKGDRDTRGALIVTSMSAFLLLLAFVRDLKVALLGSDYTRRLYLTIDVNLLGASIASIYFSVKKRWIPALAAVLLAILWLYMAGVNSVV